MKTELEMRRTRNVLLRGIADREHLGAQLYVSLADGGTADVVVGESRPGTPLRSDDVMVWMSSCKPVTAVAVMQLVERGKLQLDDPIARHIPQFAQHGKDKIAVRHLLTHTAGLRAAATNANGRPWDDVIEEICAAGPEPRWVPGQAAGYDGSAGWYILGELIARLSHLPLDQYVRQRIFLPLGMNDSWIGMPREQFRRYGDRIVPIYDTRGGQFNQELFTNTEDGITRPRPGSNGCGPTRELARLYEMLREGGTLGDTRIVHPDSVQNLVARHRTRMHDKTFDYPMDWGLGFIVNSNAGGRDPMPYGYGPYASHETFGHSGNQSSCAFCDPKHRLVVAWVCNGMPGELAHQHRQRAINASVYEDLGLVK